MTQQQPVEGIRPDSTTFTRLYEQWADAVLRYIVHLVGPGPAAEDLFQETWEHVIDRWGQLREIDRFGSWLYRIARNLAFNYKRQFKRQGQVWVISDLASKDEDATETLLTLAPDPTSASDMTAIQGERRMVLAREIERFDGQTQEMLQLRFFEGLTLAEVAAVMELPLGTVCAKVYRSLKQLQARLAEKGITSVSHI